MARKRTYQHRYSVTNCPECGHDLTSEDGVTIEATHATSDPWYVPSRLDETGLLLDAHNIVKDGLHSDTLCGECLEALNNYEETE